MAAKYVYFFGEGKAEGRGDMKNLLGGKGANLADMTSIGLPVPPGFTLTTEVCTEFYKNNRQYPAALKGQVEEALGKVEQLMSKKFGDAAKSPAGFGALRGARLHARHDGYRAQPRPQRRDHSGRHRARAATRASPTIPTGVSSRCTPTSSWA
jgi:hypothetical protein